MDSAGRFHASVSTITVTIMYGLFVHLLPLLEKLLTPGWPAELIGSALTSIALYKFVAWILEIVLARWLWLKSKIFGPSFLHGTWIGYFEGKNGDLRLVVEHFEQGFDGVVIRGKSFDMDGKDHAQWSASSVSFSPRMGELSYLSNCNIFSRNTSVASVCTFQFGRGDAADAPESLDGYSIDVNDGQRIAVKEIKLDKSLIRFEDAIGQARLFAKSRLVPQGSGSDHRKR